MSDTGVPRAPFISISGPDAVLAGDPVRWAIDRLRGASGARSLQVEVGPSSGTALTVVLRDGATEGSDLSPEAYRFAVDADGASGLRSTVVAGGERGFAYALTELAERIASDGLEGVVAGTEETHIPATPVRGMCRSFSAVHHDLPWFRDRSFWAGYLDHLATQRFNRFHLALGMQYNHGFGATGPQLATDNYLCFAYPFLIEVPGYEGVRVQGLDDDERERNLAALRHVARETRRRGMSFQLGLWNHAYDYGKGSEHWYPVLGIARETHLDYCATAVAHLLEEIPDIEGVTFRVHYEGGVPDGHSAFWERMFTAIDEVDRPVRVDLHAKGVDQAILDAVDKPNLRATLSAKYAAEHLGLPYHQASIRSLEAPMPVPEGYELMGTAEFSRRFTRYGYADFLGEDRRVDVAFRVWPGTQRLLLWGDPGFAAGYARSSTLGGAQGLEISEPLYFKGRKGTGAVGGHDPYADDELRLGLDDWRKYGYTYLLWGRLLYDPDTDPEVWRRHLRAEYGLAAEPAETALAALSRVLPLVTTAHMPSASNNSYWPEMYTDLPISPWVHALPYWWDTPRPTNWGAASPLDPTLFYGVDDYVHDALAGALSGRYTPLEVAEWLEALATEGRSGIDAIESVADRADPQVRRTLVDLRVLVQLARFFAGKFRSAVEYAFHQRTGDPGLLARTIELLEQAHAAYAAIPGIVEGVYAAEIPFGPRASEGGHWSDRLPAMQDDVRALRLELERLPAASGADQAETVRRSSRWRLADAQFDAADRYARGQAFDVRLTVGDPAAISSATLHHRRLDQSETFCTVEMDRCETGFVGAVPAAYTDTAYPLVYFVEVHRAGDHPVVFPGFDDSLSNQPYVVVHSDRYRSA